MRTWVDQVSITDQKCGALAKLTDHLLQSYIVEMVISRQQDDIGIPLYQGQT
ncbi:hypothetical protein [Alcaligenes faecalis]|uniref:hypothetical protein n=1 Tax=Alcaligenes faecalis TaxID=511 RepID=UPI002933E9B4|nr:hypothetical protein [Alcaligenes faecalis]MDV2117514.1 hypothetical protein [Alcaligenes faecalis]